MAITRTQLATYNGTHVAFPGAMTAGDVSFVFVAVFGTTTAPTGVGDNINGSYTLIGNSTSSSVGMSYLYAFFNVAAASAGACLINNISLPSGGTSIQWGAYEYGGVSSTKDGSVQANSGSGTAPSASITTTNAADLLICVVSCGSASGNTAGTGYTKQFDNATGSNLIMQDQIVSSTGTYTGAMTLGSSTFWEEIQVAFQSSTSAPINVSGSGNLSFSGTISPSLAAEPTVSGTVAVTGSVAATLAVIPVLAGTISVTGSVSPATPVTPTLTGLASVTGTVSPTFLIDPGPLSGTISVSGSVSPNVASNVSVTLSGSMLVTGTIVPDIGPVSSGTVSVTGSVTPTYSAVTPNLTGTVSVTGSVSPSFSNVSVSVTGLMSVSGVVSPFYSGGAGVPVQNVLTPWFLLALQGR